MRSPNRPWPPWQKLAPPVGLVVLLAFYGREIGPVVAVLIGVVLAVTVLAAVHHAEIVALRVGEPYGSLVLAAAVTVIEVGLIVMLMLSAGDGPSSLARDTVFAAVMIACNGIVGAAIVVGGTRHHLVRFNAEGAGAALATVTAMATVCLVLPTFTTSVAGPQFSGAQLLFAALAALALYIMFVATQTGRHRDFFLPVAVDGQSKPPAHAEPPTAAVAWVSLGLLLAALVSVVGLAKVESHTIEQAVAAVGLPQSFVGVVIALLVLAPETLAGVKAARRNRVQTSLNLAYGSGIASIGLTIPVIALLSVWLHTPLVLGLAGVQLVLLGLTVVVAVLAVVPGRATRLLGGIHLTIFAAFVFLAASP